MQFEVHSLMLRTYMMYVKRIILEIFIEHNVHILKFSREYKHHASCFGYFKIT